MNYKHLSIEERSCIRKYYVEGLSYRKIAQLIGRSPSTVSREIRRNCTHMYDIPTYYPHTAQKKYLSGLQLSSCLPRKPETACASLRSASPAGAPLRAATNSTQPSTSPSERMGAATATA